ncbi:type IV pilus modification protein PilV [Sedimenticola selenatireducens]|uniref:type IV pilus modification protein PilV n=1 Tax=Sedimenticola selenatireducens TaxID=191960 RepID=UPI0006848A9B|nr:type IV pilus modification protein PilV [Sedimenticola selenatireducens]
MRQNRIIKQQGFTLLEVLIAVLVLSIGLIGLAGMQMLGVKNNNSATMRSQAVFLTQDIADRIRANVANAGTYVVTGTPACGGLCDPALGCSGSALAAYDVCMWRTAVASLPAGVGCINAYAANSYRIRIMWDDERQSGTAHNSTCDPGSGATSGSCDAGMTCFDVEFRP